MCEAQGDGGENGGGAGVINLATVLACDRLDALLENLANIDEVCIAALFRRVLVSRNVNMTLSPRAEVATRMYSLKLSTLHQQGASLIGALPHR
jgi:hypothetical protein